MLMCAKKLYAYITELGREAKSQKVSVLTKDWGKLWLISTTASDRLLWPICAFLLLGKQI